MPIMSKTVFNLEWLKKLDIKPINIDFIKPDDADFSVGKTP